MCHFSYVLLNITKDNNVEYTQDDNVCRLIHSLKRERDRDREKENEY
jgi:hypothetical protein